MPVTAEQCHRLRGSRCHGPLSWLLPACLRLAVLALAFALSPACADDDSSRQLTLGGAHDYHGAYLLPQLGRPHFTLTATDGKPFSFAEATDGQLTLLFFGYTSCPDVCPTTMASIAEGLRQLPPSTRERVTVVFVTTDPKRDQPAVLRQWLDGFDPSFIGLTGDQADVNELMESLRLPDPVETEVTGDGYTVVHVRDVLLFTPDNIAHLIYPEGATPADWKADLEKLVNEGFKKPES